MSDRDTIERLTGLVERLAEQNAELLKRLGDSRPIDAPSPEVRERLEAEMRLMRDPQAAMRARKGGGKTEWILGVQCEDYGCVDSNGKRFAISFDVQLKDGIVVSFANDQLPEGWNRSVNKGGACPLPEDQILDAHGKESKALMGWAVSVFRAPPPMGNGYYSLNGRRFPDHLRNSADPSRNAEARRLNGWVAPEQEVLDVAAE